MRQMKNKYKILRSLFVIFEDEKDDEGNNRQRAFEAARSDTIESITNNLKIGHCTCTCKVF